MEIETQREEYPSCACGCGQRVTKKSNSFLFGHHRRLQTGEFSLCACGCGERVASPMNRYIRGHSSRKYCACGCRELAPPYHRFVLHHHKRGIKVEGPLPLCACGCGQQVAEHRNRWIRGHDKYRPELREKKLCCCGCGGFVTNVHRDWIKGHHMRLLGPPVPPPLGLPLCACGCGDPVKSPEATWIKGHSSKGRSEHPRQLCACGCGELAPKYHRYVYKHQNRGRRPHNVPDAPFPLCACGCGETVTRRSYRYRAGHQMRLLSREELMKRLGAGHTGYAHDTQAREVQRLAKLRNPVVFTPTECEEQVQIALVEAGIPFLFNVPIGEICQPDFQLPQARIVLQVDGSSHQKPQGRERDARQDLQLIAAGWEVVRWTNARVRSSLPYLMEALKDLYVSRLSCQGSVKQEAD